jgi:hypothetical protein
LNWKLPYHLSRRGRHSYCRELSEVRRASRVGGWARVVDAGNAAPGLKTWIGMLLNWEVSLSRKRGLSKVGKSLCSIFLALF